MTKQEAYEELQLFCFNTSTLLDELRAEVHDDNLEGAEERSKRLHKATAVIENAIGQMRIAI